MSAVQSPLFEPVLWQERGFKILDEIQVPQAIHYIDVTEVGQALDAVRDMKTRAFGQVLTFFYSAALAAENYSGAQAAPLRDQLRRLTEQFCAVRPTFDFRGLGAIVDGFFDQLSPDSAVGPAIAAQARQRGRQIVRGRQGRAERAAELLPNPARLLTHCNVSGELVEVARHCRALGKELQFIATETRPYLQGARLTAWELAQAGAQVALIPDCAVAQVLAAGEVNAAIVGADRSARSGDIVNKVGTYSIARLAEVYHVPFYALVQDPRGLARGADVTIEERPAEELLYFDGQPLVPGPAQPAVRYPSFDMAPAVSIARLIGFDGVYTVAAFREKYQGAESATPCSEAPGRYLLVFGVPPPEQYDFLSSALRAEQGQSVLVPEMRPWLFGPRVVVPALLERGIAATLISDNMMGTLFAQGEIKKLCYFYDRLDGAGATGLCGALLAVQLARLHGVAVELFAGAKDLPATLDRDGATFMGKAICPAGVTVRALASDIVPWEILKN